VVAMLAALEDKRKALLFYKKEAKNFYQFASMAQSQRFELGHASALIKVFLLLFLQKKKTLPFLQTPTQPRAQRE
jgi:hypothetical protein